MTLRFRKVHPDAVLPSYAHPSDAGMDVRSVEDLTIAPGKRALVHTGLVMLLPPKYEAQVRDDLAMLQLRQIPESWKKWNLARIGFEPTDVSSVEIVEEEE